MGGLGEEQREGLRGVDADTSVGEELGGEGSVGRGTLASRRWRRERSPRLASNSNIEGELEGDIPCKDGKAGHHTTGEVLHRTSVLINKMIKLGVRVWPIRPERSVHALLALA